MIVQVIGIEFRHPFSPQTLVRILTRTVKKGISASHATKPPKGADSQAVLSNQNLEICRRYGHGYLTVYRSDVCAKGFASPVFVGCSSLGMVWFSFGVRGIVGVSSPQ